MGVIAISSSDRPMPIGNELLANWNLGRISPMPYCVPTGWELVYLTSVARLESGHTPSRRSPEYWDGDIPWISLHDSRGLDVPEINATAQTIGRLGLENSSARLLPKGTIVFSRTATVGKATVMGREMATSQDFANYICGDRLHNHYLMQLLRFMAPEWRRLMAGSTLNTIYMPVFENLQILLPQVHEQEAIAKALSDTDSLIRSLEQLVAKKRDVKQGAMQELLTGRRRLPGFTEHWEAIRLGDLGSTFGGLTGKSGPDFGVGTSQYVTFMNVMSNVVIDNGTFEYVRVSPTETQNRVERGDLFFNGSSETPEEVGLCAFLASDVQDVYLNSFCFGFRFNGKAKADGLYLAYFFRSDEGRALMKPLAQGAIRYNLSKTSLLKVAFPMPAIPEQTAIASVLVDLDAEITGLENKLHKTRQIKQGMMQELLTGRIRLV